MSKKNYTGQGIDFSAVDTVARWTLGQKESEDGTEYQYVTFTAAVAQGEAVYYDCGSSNTYPAALASTALVGSVQYQIGAVVASSAAINQFGWVAVAGRIRPKLDATGASANGQLYISAATTGRFTGNATSTKIVPGLKAVGALTANAVGVASATYAVLPMTVNS